MKIIVGVVGGAALALGTSEGANANDSSAELATGGLVLTRNAAIAMRSEDLYISAEAVRVRYRFANTTSRDVTVTVAFPMPDITIEGMDEEIAVPTEDPVNLLAFSTVVDGRPVEAKVEQGVTKNGVDRTAYLQGLNIALAPHLTSTNRALDRLPKPTQDELVRLGLAVWDDYDAGKGLEHHLIANWTLKTTFFWSQTFPAKREVVIEHRYKPAVGMSAGTRWGSTYWPKTSGYAEARRRYCVDDDFIAAAAQARRPGDVSPPFTEQRIEYVLTTGANWKAPIGEFRMVVDKGDATSLVSFCGGKVRKIGPTTFEFRHTDFRPKRDVSVLILKRREP